ncbi:MAG TPA: hypothetical protein EYN73_02555 [Chromatiaceae bacterium]|nr:hypothetical protein [Chromatiaceae bacterium]HIN82474.1 hypothetical protein [Chromatiales bacterium]HIA07958.1 hypothetical protein [Chromatiaceae bacterium]HIB85191.1 hypothetical protein [Chromatiaceae bacterium]HIO15057.1 hypothetical protein [Chromatiales bacterium]
MSDLFTVTAPLLIRYPNGATRVMAEKFPHPKGMLFFELFWNKGKPADTIHLVEGGINGDGPWKIGDCVITVLGYQHTNPEEATELDRWMAYLSIAGDEYPSIEVIDHIARQNGAEFSNKR